MKERPILFSAPMVRAILDGAKTQTRRIAKPQPSVLAHTTTPDGRPMQAWWETGKEIHQCPFGQPGDRLWVREAWARTYVAQARKEWFVYRAADNRTDYGGPWKPSIHMPRAACRIVLEVTDVRVERLQDISRNDAVAEGVEAWAAGALSPQGRLEYPRVQFAMLWQSINGADSWEANPWVWVVGFRRIAA